MSGTAHGFHTLSESGNDYNKTAAVVEKMLNRVHTAAVVKIVAVTNSGGVSPVGYVDVQPMVKQINGKGQGTSHGTIHRLPYVRAQGGTDAVIIDPKVGDLGMVVFASRDLSNVKENKTESLPGSFRTHDMADGLYVGGLLNGTPTQFVQFSADGITLTSPTKVTISAPAVTITSDDVEINGTTLKHNGVNVGSTHKHADAQGGTTGVPQ